jgi:hypothetical protein
MKAILVATIGTRDLMFEVKNKLWYSVGNDRLNSGSELTEQLQVSWDIKFPSDSTYRSITEYFLAHQAKYIDRLMPVIIGKLISDHAPEIEKVYLIVTNQKEHIPQREKDTIHSGGLITAWITKKYPTIAAEVIELGPEGTNPASFEETFNWWYTKWHTKITTQHNQEIWLCLKGGVGQTSEAGRISGLNLYAEQIKFFESIEDSHKNRQGICSDYIGPLLGSNYLWVRTQKQALTLLDRPDFAGAQAILSTYINNQKISETTTKLLDAGIAWNQGQFESFFDLAQQTLTPEQQQQQSTWWWMAYEQAYLAIIRLQQANTTEAMLHSFRAIEGCLLKWVKENSLLIYHRRTPAI